MTLTSSVLFYSYTTNSCLSFSFLYHEYLISLRNMHPRWCLCWYWQAGVRSIAQENRNIKCHPNSTFVLMRQAAFTFGSRGKHTADPSLYLDYSWLNAFPNKYDGPIACRMDGFFVLLREKMQYLFEQKRWRDRCLASEYPIGNCF